MLILVRHRVRDHRFHLFDRWKDIGEGWISGSQSGATAQSGFDQRLGPDAVLMGLPEFVASIGLQPLDTGFSALAPLHHALDCLQPVKVIASHATIADGEGFFGGSAERKLYGRNSPGDSQA